jgi:hypothetical protein
LSARVRFDRHELAGAFGDIGTDLPLLIGLCATCHLDSGSVFSLFGLMQMLTGLRYGLPMPVQPLKAMTTIMLAQRLPTGVFFGAGLVVGAAMLVLTASGLLRRIAQWVPRSVVRGLQLGLAITLGRLALGTYCMADGRTGMILAAGGLLLFLLLRRQRRIPAPLVLITIGVIYALIRRAPLEHAATAFGLHLPTFVAPTLDEMRRGALILALPQLALSLGNSVLATTRASADLFPERPVSVRSIGYTYAAMNLIAPWFGGVPTCHGCGGLVGFYNFGARTGGAPILYGAMYLVAGFLFAPALNELVLLFPLPILGVVLLLESLGLARLCRDVIGSRAAIFIVAVVTACVLWAPYGYFVALVVGTLVARIVDPSSPTEELSAT